MARILHIEDDPKNRLLVRKLLQAAGHEVIDAESGLEGIRLAEAEQPQLVLVDINIPDLDGYEVTLRLRGIQGLTGVSIVAITAEGDREISLAMGADGFIAKPIDPARFGATVGRYLKGYREEGRAKGDGRLRQQSQKIVQRLERTVEQLSVANRRLEEMARLRREFLQNVSHELATPMTPVVGYLDLLLNEELGSITAPQRKALTALRGSTERLRSVSDMLVDVSELETRRMVFTRDEFDLVETAVGAIRDVRSLFQERSVSLQVEPAPTGIHLHGDADKIGRAMVHVLDNASKFTPAGGEVVVALRPDGGVASFVVADSGPGVGAGAIEKILEPFYQVDGSVTRRHGGVGLGLAFARHVCEQHGGSVRVLSPPDREICGVILGGTQIELGFALDPPQST